jgi:hypothetical protein
MIIICDLCYHFYEDDDHSYCEKCGLILSGDQIDDLMMVVKEMDHFDLDSDVYVANVSSLVRKLCWYDESDYAYQKKCYEYLETQHRTPQIEKALNFFGGEYCGMVHDVRSMMT